MTEMTKRSSSILTSRWTSRRIEAAVGGRELKMLKKRKLAWLEQRDKDGQSCSNLYPYHKTAAHSHMTLLSFLTITQLSLFLTWDTFSSLDCDLIHMTALLLDHFASYGSQDKALKCFIFVEWLMWPKKSSLLIG